LALLYGAIVGCFGVFVPGVWLDWRKARRQRQLRRSLPDYLDLLTACMEGGTGMQAVMLRVTDELRTAHPLLAGEMAMVQREIDLGRGTSEALQHLAQRCDLDEFRSLATFVSHAERFGTTMSDALRELSEMLRFQRENRAEEMAHKASVKILVPTLLFIFPAVFVVLAGPAAIKLQSMFKAAPKSVPKDGPNVRPVAKASSGFGHRSTAPSPQDVVETSPEMAKQDVALRVVKPLQG
jgi:tight adherence protein C